jgi:hypothetical protein
MRYVVAVAVIAAAAIVGAVIAIRPGDSNPPSTAKQERRAAPPVAVPRSDDPATQARQLSDFLRAQSRPGAANAQQP